MGLKQGNSFFVKRFSFHSSNEWIITSLKNKQQQKTKLRKFQLRLLLSYQFFIYICIDIYTLDLLTVHKVEKFKEYVLQHNFFFVNMLWNSIFIVCNI